MSNSDKNGEKEPPSHWKRRSSILKLAKNPSSEDLTESEGFTQLLHKSGRRVSFASSSTVKPFAADPEKITIWDTTYEEQIKNSTETTHSSHGSGNSANANTVVDFLNTTRIDCTQLMDVDMELTHMPETEKENSHPPVPNARTSIVQYARMLRSSSSQIGSKNETIQSRTVQFEENFSNMRMTCQLPVGFASEKITSKKVQSQTSIVSSAKTRELCQTPRDVIMMVNKENIFPAEVSGFADMSMTCQIPVGSVNTHQSEADMEFTCKVPFGISSQSGAATCTNNPKPLANMDLTCQTQGEANMVVGEDNKTATELSSSANMIDMSMTCQVPVGFVPAKEVSKNFPSQTALISWPNTRELCQTPREVIMMVNKENIVPAKVSGCTDMSLTCQIPVGSVHTHQLEADMEFTCINNRRSLANMDLTCQTQGEASMVVGEDNKTGTELSASANMSLTCQVPVDFVPEKEFSKNVPSQTGLLSWPNTRELCQTPKEVMMVNKENIIPAEVSGCTDMSMTCQIPVGSVHKHQSEADMDFTCKIPLDISSQSGAATCINNRKSLANMDLTCQTQGEASMVVGEDNKTATELSASSNMSMTCRVPVDFVPEKEFSKNVPSQTGLFSWTNTRELCQTPREDIMMVNKENIVPTELSGCTGMSMTCQVPVGSVHTHQSEADMEFTCKIPLDISSQSGAATCINNRKSLANMDLTCQTQGEASMVVGEDNKTATELSASSNMNMICQVPMDFVPEKDFSKNVPSQRGLISWTNTRELCQTPREVIMMVNKENIVPAEVSGCADMSMTCQIPVGSVHTHQSEADMEFTCKIPLDISSQSGAGTCINNRKSLANKDLTCQAQGETSMVVGEDNKTGTELAASANMSMTCQVPVDFVPEKELSKNVPSQTALISWPNTRELCQTPREVIMVINKENIVPSEVSGCTDMSMACQIPVGSVHTHQSEADMEFACKIPLDISSQSGAATCTNNRKSLANMDLTCQTQGEASMVVGEDNKTATELSANANLNMTCQVSMDLVHVEMEDTCQGSSELTIGTKASVSFNISGKSQRRTSGRNSSVKAQARRSIGLVPPVRSILSESLILSKLRQSMSELDKPEYPTPNIAADDRSKTIDDASDSPVAAANIIEAQEVESSSVEQRNEPIVSSQENDNPQGDELLEQPSSRRSTCTTSSLDFSVFPIENPTAKKWVHLEKQVQPNVIYSEILPLRAAKPKNSNVENSLANLTLASSFHLTLSPNLTVCDDLQSTIAEDPPELGMQEEVPIYIENEECPSELLSSDSSLQDSFVGSKLTNVNDTYMLKNKMARSHQETITTTVAPVASNSAHINWDLQKILRNWDSIKTRIQAIKENPVKLPEEKPARVSKIRDIKELLAAPPQKPLRIGQLKRVEFKSKDYPALKDTIKKQRRQIEDYVKNFKVKPPIAPDDPLLALARSSDAQCSSTAKPVLKVTGFEEFDEVLKPKVITVAEKIKAMEKRNCVPIGIPDPNGWRIHSLEKDCVHCSMLNKTVNFKVRFDSESGIVSRCEVEAKEQVDPYAQYTCQYVLSKLSENHIHAAIGNTYDVLSLLQYVEILDRSCLKFHLHFENLLLYGLAFESSTIETVSSSLVWEFWYHNERGLVTKRLAFIICYISHYFRARFQVLSQKKLIFWNISVNLGNLEHLSDNDITINPECNQEELKRHEAKLKELARSCPRDLLFLDHYVRAVYNHMGIPLQ